MTRDDKNMMWRAVASAKLKIEFDAIRGKTTPELFDMAKARAKSFCRDVAWPPSADAIEALRQEDQMAAEIVETVIRIEGEVFKERINYELTGGMV